MSQTPSLSTLVFSCHDLLDFLILLFLFLLDVYILERIYRLVCVCVCVRADKHNHALSNRVMSGNQSFLWAFTLITKVHLTDSSQCVYKELVKDEFRHCRVPPFIYDLCLRFPLQDIIYTCILEGCNSCSTENMVF